MQCDKCGRELGTPGVRPESEGAAMCDQCVADLKPETPPDTEPREASILDPADSPDSEPGPLAGMTVSFGLWVAFGLFACVISFLVGLMYMFAKQSEVNLTVVIIGLLPLLAIWPAWREDGRRGALAVAAGLGVFLLIFGTCMMAI